MLSLARLYRPLVCEGDGRAKADSEAWRVQLSGRELIHTIKIPLQFIVNARFIFGLAVFLLGRTSATLSQSRASAYDLRVSIRSGHRRHVGVNCHKVTTLPGVLNCSRSRPGQEKRSCVFQTHHAGNLHRRRKKTFTRHPRDTLRSHLSCIRCEWCSPH